MKRISIAAAALVFALGIGLVLWAGDELGKMELTRLHTRAGWQLPERVVEALDLSPGDVVADIGSGDGYFTFYLAEAVGPSGRVYAVDVSERALERLAAEAERRGLDQVETILAEVDDPLLPDGEVDLAFLCNSYHHIDRRAAYFDRLRGDLSERGRLAIVEGKTEGFSRIVSPPGHGTSVPDLVAELRVARYQPEQSFDFLPVQSFEVFRPEAQPLQRAHGS